VTASRKTTLLYSVIALGIASMPMQSHAQWWKPRAPIDFEECADNAERTAASKEAKTSLLSECESKFAGRRKPGGGYTYYDFMQNRHFDIAGPNPTKEELKQIDEQYTAFLDNHRRSVIAAAFTQKQQQQTELALAKEKPQLTAKPVSRVPIPVSRPRVRAKDAECNDNSLSCGWSQLATKIQNIKKTLLGPSPKKTNRS
jgi:hypothetical protein